MNRYLTDSVQRRLSRSNPGFESTMLLSCIYMKISPERIKEIEILVEAVLNDVCGKIEIAPPIDLKKILEKYEVSLKEGDFGDSNIAGAFDRAAKVIYISKADSPKRKQFTIAHELGHLLLHENQKEIFYRTQFIEPDKQTVTEEVEANWFAASLLMPRRIFVRYWERVPDESVIADIFGVSPSAVHWRVKNLELEND